MKRPKNVVFKFFELVKGQRLSLFSGAFFSLLTALLLAIIFNSWRLLLDSAVDGDASIFYTVLPVSLSLIIFVVASEILSSYSLGRYAELSTAKLRYRMVQKTNKLQFAYLDSEHSGELLSKMTNDINQVREYFFSHFSKWIFLPVMAIIALGYMFWVDWSLTMFTIMLIPVFGYISSIISRKMEIDSKQLHDKLGKLGSAAQDAVQGFEINKAFGIEARYEEEYNKEVDESVFHSRKLAKKKGLINGLAVIFGLMPFLMCVMYGGYLVSLNRISIGQMLVFVQFLNFLINPMQELPELMAQTRSTSASLDRINDFLRADEEVHSGKSHPSNTQWAIEMEDIDFAYDEVPVLSNLNLRIHNGEKVALVGSSGSGKSTILKLLAALYTENKGALRFFGVDKEQWSLSEWRKNLAFVTQDTYLYPVSVGENIALGKADASKEEIIEAAKAADAHDFICDLPQGYDTLAGELGSRLSGGQKQRIAIARAFLKDAKVLLFDEATSALDTETEQQVHDAFLRLSENKTCITVAHRLSTIKEADRILLIDKGRIVEEGTHEVLLKKKTLYFQLYHKLFKPKQHEVQNLELAI